MSSSRPYLVRALYEWIVDNGCTPYLLVDAEAPAVDVPRQFVKDGQIVLNISPTAVADLLMSNESISFSARFGGVPTGVFVPSGAVLGVYARENGQGMLFEGPEPSPEPPSDGPEPGGAGEGPSRGNGRPSLKVVK